MGVAFFITAFVAGFFIAECLYKDTEIKKLKKEIIELQQEYVKVLNNVKIYIKRVNEIAENNFNRFSNN